MTKILVTGANGQLGLSLADIASTYSEMQFIFADKRMLDITDTTQLRHFIQTHHPDYIINTAAYTAVDDAEKHPQSAMLINATSVGELGKICAAENIPIVHISSDYVYHPKHDTPMDEMQKTTPIGVYAKSKLAGEQRLIQSGAPAIITRSSWIYSEHGSNFVKTIIRLAKNTNELSIVNDQIGTPTYARDLAKAILDIIGHSMTNKIVWTGEIYNYCNEGYTNWADFARFFLNEMNIQTKIRSIPSEEYPTAAERPKNSRMQLDKIKETWQLSIRHWQVACREMLSALKSL